MGEWRDTPLSEVADLLPGYAFKGMDFGVGTSRGVKIKDVQTGVVAVESLDALDVTSYNQERIKKYRLNAGDHLITMTGNLGRVATIPDSPNSIYLNQRVAKLLPKANVVEDFLLYVIKSSDFIDYCVTHADSETAQPNISAGTILEYEFSLPPEDEQRAIASVLSSLDAKIDLLHRQNKTLEAMAEALFRQWFVEEAEEGWEEVLLGTYIRTNERSLTKDTPLASIKYLDTGAITKGHIERFEELAMKDAPSRARRLVQHNDIVYSTVRPIHCHYGMIKDPPPDLVVSTGFCVVTAKTLGPHFVYYLLTTPDMTEFLHSVAEGSTSTYPSLKPNDIEAVEFQLPPKQRMDEFEAIAAANWDRISNNYRQIRSLTALRDTLLPKLMSGEVRVEMNYQAQDH